MFLVDSKQELDSLKMQLPGFDQVITAAHSIVSVPHHRNDAMPAELVQADSSRLHM